MTDATRRTKIVATIGPASSTHEVLRALVESGVDAVRLNLSHGTHDQHREWAQLVRDTERELGRPIALIADLQGPKLRIGDVDVSGLATALIVRYDDDEPGSPWTIVLHVDATGDESQQNALADVFLGRHGGPQVGVLPWVRKMSNLVDVRPDRIELVAQGEGYELRIGEAVHARATRPVPSDAVVRCVIPGYDQPGHELVADELTVHDDPFAWELRDNCAFASRFDYASE